MDYSEIILTVHAEDIDTAADIANMVVPYGIYIEDYRNLEADVSEIAHIDLIDDALRAKDRSTGKIHLYIDPASNPSEAVAYLTERLQDCGIPFSAEQKLCREEDWANNWKDYFYPVEVGERLLICPTFRDIPETRRTVLRLDPGMAFGTGAHETTRLCMQLIEQYCKTGDTMLDIGCGTGILAVTALLLGASKAVGVDIDPLSVKTASENASLNGLSDRFTPLCGDLTDQVSGKYDLIAANIVADVILKLNTHISDYLKADSVYLMSGIIDTREDEVLYSLQDRFEVLKILRERGWTAIAARLK